MDKNNFTALNQPITNELIIDEQKYLYFGGTAYLGISQNRAIHQWYLEGLQKYGLNNGTSRGNNVQLSIYNEAEDFFAKRFGAETSLVISSGFMAVSLTVKACQSLGEIRYAPDTHPALWLDNKTPSVKATSFKEWAEEIVSEINRSSTKNWVLISNSVNNLFPEIYDFTFVEQVNKDKSITLIIDDSHGIGILNQGNSVLNAIPKLANIEVIVAASLAKAIGLDAGIVLAQKERIQELKLTDEFYGASPPSAAGLYAFIKGQESYIDAYHKLCSNMDYFSSRLRHQEDWAFVEQFPVYLTKKIDIEKTLLDKKILISSFPYPNRNGKPLNRMVLSSWHNKENLDTLLEFC